MIKDVIIAMVIMHVIKGVIIAITTVILDGKECKNDKRLGIHAKEIIAGDILRAFIPKWFMDELKERMDI